MLFISPQKLFPFPRYLSLCVDFLVMYPNSLIKKMRLISNFMTSQPGQQTIVIHILVDISRRKYNQTIKFGQLTESNLRNIFLEKSYTKCGGKTSPKSFSEKLKLSMSLDRQSKMLYSLLVLHNKLRASKYIKTKLQTACVHLILDFIIKESPAQCFQSR